MLFEGKKLLNRAEPRSRPSCQQILDDEIPLFYHQSTDDTISKAETVKLVFNKGCPLSDDGASSDGVMDLPKGWTPNASSERLDTHITKCTISRSTHFKSC